MTPSPRTALTTWDRLDCLIHGLAPPVLTLLKQNTDALHFRRAAPIVDEGTAAAALAMINAATREPPEEPWFEECNHALRYITLALERPHDSALFARCAVGAAITAARESLETARFKKWSSLEGTAKVALHQIEKAREALGV